MKLAFRPVALAPVVALALLAPRPEAQSLSSTALLPGDSAIAPAAGDQLSPALCRGGNQVLAVWQDGRTNPQSLMLDDQSGQDIYAARLDATGALIDAFPIVVNQDAGNQTAPRAAWNGSEWLVAWTSQVPTEFFWTTAIQAARVAADGSVLDASPITLGIAANSSAEFWGLASDGSSFLAVWKDWTGTAWRIFGQRVAADGSLLDAAPVTLVGSVASQPFTGDVAFAGDEYLVVWNEWTSAGLDDVRGRRFNATLGGLGGVAMLAADSDYDVAPSIATDGTGFFVAWERYNTCCGLGGQVRGTRVSHAGAVLDGAAGLAIYNSGNEITTGRLPAVVWDGQAWIVSFVRSSVGFTQSVYAARVSAGGVVLDPGGLPVNVGANNQYVTAAAGLPSGGALIAWDDVSAGGITPWDVRAATFANGTTAALGAIALGAPTQIAADAADAGDATAIAFLSAVSGAQRVLVSRVDAAGAPLDAEPVQVAGFGADVANPNIAWNGSVFLVSWDSAAGVKARRFDAGLTPLDAAPIAVMPGNKSDVAALGDTFLVSGTASPGSPEISFVYTRRVSGSTGALLDAAPVAVGGSFAGSSAVTAFAGGFLVSWQAHFSHDDNHADVLLRFVSAANVPGASLNATSAYLYERLPRVAASDGVALVTWHQDVGSGDMVLRGRRISPAGAFLGPAFVVDDAALEQQNGAVAWTGSEFAAGWEDHRGETWLLDSRSDAFGARVTEGGAVLDPTGFALADGPLPQYGVAVAGGQGSATYAFSSFEPGAPYAGYRIGVRVLNPGLATWTNLAHALAGVHGLPQLAGTGTLQAGSTVTLALSGAKEGSATALIVGLSAANLPFKGGTLVPTPDLIFGGLFTNATGSLSLSSTWPAGVPSGFAFWNQMWISDASGPAGLAASNGLKASTP